MVYFCLRLLARQLSGVPETCRHAHQFKFRGEFKTQFSSPTRGSEFNSIFNAAQAVEPSDEAEEVEIVSAELVEDANRQGLHHVVAAESREANIDLRSISRQAGWCRWCSI